MNTYNTAKSIGIVAGIIIGLIIVVFILRYTNKDKALRTEYDEMQKIVRLRGYKYAFYTVIILEAVLAVCSGIRVLDIHTLAVPIVVHFLPILLGVTVHAGYSIWNDAYVGLNTNMGRFIPVSIVISLVNLGVAFAGWRIGELYRDGMFQAQTVNLLCGLMFGILGVIALIRKAAGSRDED